MAKKTVVSETEPVKEQSSVFIPVTADKDGDEIHFQVRKSLPLSACTRLVMDIADIVLIDGTYVPTVEEFALLSTVLAYYTDITLDDMSIDEIDQLCRRTDIIDCICQSADIDMEYFREKAQKLISWRKEQILRSKSDQLYEAVTNVVNHLDKLLSQLDGADLGKIDELTALAQAVAQKSERELGHGIIEFREAQKAAAPKKRSVRKKAPATEDHTAPVKE